MIKTISATGQSLIQTNIQIPEEIYRAVKEYTAKTNMPFVRFVRAALQNHLDALAPPPPTADRERVA
jgi:predicted DNA binding CopG/RHH family protein